MLAARRLTWARVRSAAAVLGRHGQSLPQAPRLHNNAACALHTGSKTAWQKANTVDDFRLSQPTIAAANLLRDQKMLQVRWENGSVDSYPYIWLRDNCQCPKCYHPVSLARRVLLKDLDLSVNCVDIKLSNTGEEVEMLWTDGHQGTYDAHWLHERAFRGPKPAPHDREFRLKQQLWGREMQDKLPRISFPDIIHDDHSLLNFLESLEVMGVVLVSDVPCEIDQIYSFAKRIGHLRPTHYGETFNVYSRMDPNNLAYTGDSLDMHTDLPCLATKPEIQMLHVIKQFIGEGGDTMITDGFHAASKFKKNNPEYFDTLANTLIEFVDVGVDDGIKFHVCSKAPIIDVDIDGSIRNVNWHQMSRDSRFEVSSPEAAAKWYAASLAFRDMLYDPDNLVKLKLQSGDMIVFDNLRVMHGRQGYRADRGERWLQGGYLEWDSVRSLRRVLRKNINT